MARQHHEDPGFARGARTPDWRAIAASDQFRELSRAKRRFVIPAAVFFVVYYFTLPVLVGFFPGVVSRPVCGHINIAYVFALSQFIMAWVVMWLYLRAARRWDVMEHDIIDRVMNDA